MAGGDDNNSSLTEAEEIFGEGVANDPVITEPNPEDVSNDVEQPVMDPTEEPTNEGNDPVAEGTVDTPLQTQLTDDLRLMAMNEMFPGRFDTVDALNEYNLLERADKHDELVDEYNQLVDEYEALQAKEPEFANDFVKKLNTWVGNGGKPEDFIQFQSVDFKEMAPIDLLAYNLKRENPSLTDAEIRSHLSRTYKTDADKYTEDEVAQGEFQLKLDSNKALASLEKVQQENLVQIEEAKTEEPGDANTEELMRSWEPSIGKVVSDFKNVFIPVNDEVGFNLEILPEELKSIESDLYDAIETLGLEHNEAGLKEAQQYVQDRYIAQNWPSLVKAVASKVRGMSDQEWLNQVHNPSALNKTDEPVVTPQKDLGDQALEGIFELEGE